MDDGNTEKFAEHFRALKDSASQLLTRGAEAFREGRPEDYAALHAEYESGAAELGITVRVLPELIVECWASIDGGERQVFATLYAYPERAPHAVN